MNKKFIVPTWYVAFTRYGMADCVVRHAHVRPEVSDWSIEGHVTFSVSYFRDLLQRVIFVLQWPSETRLFRVGVGWANDVILALESYFLYSAFRFNCMENMASPLDVGRSEQKNWDQFFNDVRWIDNGSLRKTKA